MTEDGQFDFTDCCKVWTQIKNTFGWYSGDFEDGKWFVMPYITGDDGSQYRVQFCPACKADRRNAAMKALWQDGLPVNDQAAMLDALEWLDYLRSIEHTCIKSAENRERLARCIADLKRRTGAE